MSEKIYVVPESFAKEAHIDKAGYEAMYAASISDNAAFWGEHGKRIDWFYALQDRQDRLLQARRRVDPVV